MQKIVFIALISAVLSAVSAIADEAKIVIPYQFEEAKPFSDGIAAVKKSGAWGYIDNHAQWIIEPKFKYPSVGDFSFGMAFVLNEFITPKGTPAFEEKIFQDARPFRAAAGDGGNPLAPVKSLGLWGYIGIDGEFKIAPKYDGAGEFSHAGLAPVKSGGLWGYIDAQGREVIPPSYDYAWKFSGEFAAVLLGGKVGYINRNGQYAIMPSFKSAGPFKNGRAFVRQGENFGFINGRGQMAIPARYNGAGEFDDGLAPVATSNRWGYIDSNGNMVLPPLYDKAERFSEGLAAVEQDGLWGYIEAKRY